MAVLKTFQLKTADGVSLGEAGVDCEQRESITPEAAPNAGGRRIIVMTCTDGQQSPPASLERLLLTRAQIAGDTSLADDIRKTVLDALDAEIRRTSPQTPRP
jgi:hypothetical protein